ncbi:MAG: polyprenyl synthetase family protein [Bacteriovoracaceae bacterium]|nr:polyprenyl synthetase family protein [Bacteriovoracaceae bacterium]
MDIAKTIETLSHNLSEHIDGQTPNHHIREVYRYAVLPAGKLFRPLLVSAIAKDFSISKQVNLTPKSGHSLLASAIEIHHAYSLVHDDLPCMDDDDMRRGRPSTHKAYGEWKALLVGDGLLNLSYRLISLIDSKNLSNVFRFFSWSTGAKGLIHGQVLDLSEEMKENFTTLLDTHRFKTARLIQNSMVSSYFLIEDKKTGSEHRQMLDIFKLGHYTGIVFQLLDDLTEFADYELSEHEKEISPWFNFSDETNCELLKGLERITELSDKHLMDNYKTVMKIYFGKICKILTENQSNVQRHLKDNCKKEVELLPIMTLLKRVS